MEGFRRMDRLPPYMFKVVDKLKIDLRHEGVDIVDLGMGNPDIPTPRHIVEKLIEAAEKPASPS
jgi:alanine-synthesizing transaminase